MFKKSSKFHDSLLAYKLWQDRQILFDISDRKLKLIPGESIVEHFKSVEDTKGNNGEMGSLTITNLRILWISNINKYINLSIGFDNLLNVYVKIVNSKLRGGEVQSLNLLSQANNQKRTRYEFQFTILTDANSGLKDSSIYNVIKATQAAYESTRLYREIKLRSMGMTIQSLPGQTTLKLLPNENIIDTIDSVMSLSADSGNLGSLFLTNIRVVWIAKLVEDYSLTVPWCSIAKVSIKDSKFDKALVVETFNKGINDTEVIDGYNLGFRLGNIDILTGTLSQMSKLLKTSRKNPILGIDKSKDDEFSNLVSQSKIREGFIGHTDKKGGKSVTDFLKNVGSGTLEGSGSNEDGSKMGNLGVSQTNESDYIDNTVKAKNYETSTQVEKSDQPVKYFYCQEIGVAVQELQPGQALSSLWTMDLPEVDCNF